MRLSWSLPFLCLWVSLAANQGTPPPLPPEPARSVKVLVSEGCPQADEQGPAPDALELEPGAPLVLTHRINLVPSCPGGAGPDLTALRQRLERLEGELSELREKCTAQGGCCSEQRTATGPGSCAPQGCPDDCSDQGRCEEGRCVCFPGFTGPSCGVRSCPAGCHGRGQCVEGRCVCDGGFTGEDCSRPRCPGDCSGRGSCARGRCQCRPGYGGPDCSQSVAPPTTATPPPGCPGNCGDRGRCVQGECVCDAGFTGVDCSTVVPVVLQLNTSNITDSSVTLTWTRPTAPVDSYHITFSSGKESDQKVTSQVRGGLTTYTQTGLAPAQEYRVSVRAEKDRRQGAESSTHFRTLISGPKNLHVVKTTTSSVIIQWDRSVSVIDRYRLTYVPSDGWGPAQEMTLPRDKSSAHLPQLQAGLQYNVTLWAERGRGQSPPVTVQATPGPEPPSQLAFSNVTDSSFTLSWVRPSAPISSFKITYTHLQEGEPRSLSVGGQQSSAAVSRLRPGSRYEVSVLSVLGLDESRPLTGVVLTVPDAPTDLRAINVTDSRALLLWRPALATVDRYLVLYGAQNVPEVLVSASGNTAELQLKGLLRDTVYTVRVTSEAHGARSSPATLSFSTTGAAAAGEGPRDLGASQVTPRSAVLSWKPPRTAVTGYRLTYHTAAQELQELILEPNVTQVKLSRLAPVSLYTARLQALRGEQRSAALTVQFTTGSLRFPFPVDCSQELLNGLLESGETTIYPGGAGDEPLRVFCDMETDGGGWTVFQRRMNGKTNFFRKWKEYKAGFGNLSEEFWLGNDALHRLTRGGAQALRVDLRAGGESAFAKYSSFSIDTERQHYRLQLSGYSGTAGDSLSYHDGRPFSSRDRDPWPLITRCAMSYRGGWWYRNCHFANLNGLYDTHKNHQGIIWTDWKGKNFSIPFTEMKIRPAAFVPPDRHRDELGAAQPSSTQTGLYTD